MITIVRCDDDAKVIQAAGQLLFCSAIFVYLCRKNFPGIGPENTRFITWPRQQLAGKILFSITSWQHPAVGTLQCLLSSVNTAMLTSDIDIGILSVRLSRSDTVSKCLNMPSRHHGFTDSSCAHGGPIILVFPVINIFVKFRWGHPLREC